ncbi:MAG: copper chaperone PCu(A)C [Gracilimonas sp.]
MMLLSACTTKKTDAEMNQNGNQVRVDERVRPAASGGTSAAYFAYTNLLSTTDTLRSLNSDVAKMTQVHESYKTEDGMMGMREKKDIVLQPGEEIQFKQGGLHIMLMGIEKDLNSEDSVTVRLNFAEAGEFTKRLPVKP